MTSPTPDGERAGQRPADFARPEGPNSADDAANSAPSNVRPERFEYAETALGGADSVQKTSYVTGEGTEPEGAPRAGVVARTTSGGGINVAAWVIGLVAALIALIYAFGIFR
ncbi:MAG TPA: hypothetical protein VFJ74_02770 [Gemmatimonadaceae bacterium]|nr:hypothetical protein [Gemmatimonadaceae bacterium]